MADAIPMAFATALDAYVAWMQVHHYRLDSTRARRRGVAAFAAWCGQQGITNPSEVAFDHCERYAAHLEKRDRHDGKGRLSRSSRVNLLGDVREFFRFAVVHDFASWNPAADVDGPLTQVASASGNQEALTLDEIERVLVAPDTATPDGLRDRAILETLYSTGIRRAELVHLCLGNVYADGVVRIDNGKGGKDRVVPIGTRALQWIARYRSEVRVVRDPLGDARALFLTADGQPLTERGLDTLVTKSFRAAGITAPGGCHLLRHTCATHLLEGGADLASVQRMLGHARMTTTSHYTHPCMEVVHAAWRRTHPAAMGQEGDDGDRDLQAVPRIAGIIRQPTSWWWLRRLRQQTCRA